MTNHSVQAWIHAFRLRTLPLSVSGIILGSGIARGEHVFRWPIFILALITTLLLQILSNLANDYGDFKSGVDNKERVGPQRSVQSGAISSGAMKKMVIFISGLTLIIGLTLVAISFHQIASLKFLIFIVIGLSAIVAAIKYTVGNNPYGYQGLGDIMVFLFFGLASVWGTHYLHTHQMDWWVLLPASSIGLLSAGVLNVNNMRDTVNDRQSGKRTLAVLFGFTGSKWYHLLIIIIGFILMPIYFVHLHKFKVIIFLLIPGFPLVIHGLKIWKTGNPAEFDPELKRLSLSTLLLAIVSGVLLGYSF